MYGLTKLKKTNTDKNINREDSLSIFLFQKNFQKNKKFLKKVLTVRVGHDILIYLSRESDKDL